MTNLLILAGGGGGAVLLIVIMVLVGRRSRTSVAAVVPPPHVDIAPVVRMAPPTRVARGSVEFPTSEKRPSRPTGIRPSHAGRAMRTP